ncbi:hypothetical protein PAAG_12355 [Paracoccidioides lutzii Pb01]|uniref:Uncharacterized protein n=1 Tax=Paracoccidioides lutzii (strain ATCC MYA-826 / Pb01) TaxID=502779 RepID=A0A0A2V3M8_PARBA|nr:hypothetical protein PAAG_12355 [Paracoccidioides lutzii Pb01]KGQ00982.1 hypothetical protein PAAG_12355 [Paracoccidioides lutzii Pb01]
MAKTASSPIGSDNDALIIEKAMSFIQCSDLAKEKFEAAVSKLRMNQLGGTPHFSLGA